MLSTFFSKAAPRKNTTRLAFGILSVLVIGALSACGQRGDLVLPVPAEPDQTDSQPADAPKP